MAELAPISVQLYSLREQLAQDFEGVVRKLADIGFVGVEPYNTMPVSAQEAAKLFQELGLQVPSAHIAIPLGDDQQARLDTAAAYGVQYYVVPSSNRDLFTSRDGVMSVVDQLHQAQEVVEKQGMILGYHNHEYEFQRIDGQFGYELLAENLNPNIVLQVDTYWAQAGGKDPAQLVTELGKRAFSLHVKDGPAVRGEPQVALGEGQVDVPAIVKASAGAAEWLIIELDLCATDMMTAVEKGYHYLVEKGFGRGNK